MTPRRGLAGPVARAFLHSKLTPLLIAAALGLGFLALSATPREEEPQIRVPMVDVFLADPGFAPADVERRLVDPVEKAVWGLAGVEHVYSSSRTGGALVTIRFRVGEDNEASLVKVYERVGEVVPRLPPGAAAPIVELHSIDDVPFLAFTLSSQRRSSSEIRPIAQELAREIAEIPASAHVSVIGGEPRAVRVEPDLARMAGDGVTWEDLSRALAGASARRPAGTAVESNREIRVEAGTLFQDAAQIRSAVVAVHRGAPIVVSDIAGVEDGPDEATSGVFIYRRGVAAAPAVTVVVSKRHGANATTLARRIISKVDDLRPRLLPADVRLDVTRNDGETADEKSRELIDHLLLATLSVTVLIALAMGWRSAAVVAIAVPVTLALTLFVYFVFGYTLNRVTLFALIFSIGILVDDAIVVVENIERHHRERPAEPLSVLAVHAVAEVGNPTILATFTVIAAILPMAFVRGLMGPYMRPIPVGASVAMLFSLATAFIVSPWAAIRIFRNARKVPDRPDKSDGAATRLYRRVMAGLLESRRQRIVFFTGVAVLMGAAVATVPLGLVRVKMLPFDNKSAFQVLLDQDEGTSLEVTLDTARRVAARLNEDPAISGVEVYAGIAAPYNFNGLVRHYYLRRDSNRADLEVHLPPKSERHEQSHEIARRVRLAIEPIARARHARLKVVEIPPGPPVLDTLVAELYGPDARTREKLSAAVRNIFETTEGVVDVDSSVESARPQLVLAVDAEKSEIHGIAPSRAAEVLSQSGGGITLGALDAPASREPVAIRLRLAAADRASAETRLSMRLANANGDAIELAEIVRPTLAPEPQPILHKDLKPVAYVFGDLAGKRESPIYALAAMNRKIDALSLDGRRVGRTAVEPPETSAAPALKWDGEWQITYEVFRDLGAAFAVVLVLIAILVVAWFQSFRAPIAILLPIPLSLIGILPGHALFGAYFTATSMIGFIAGAGIIVRNSIILVDFIEHKVGEGMDLKSAVIEAGAVRFRPMLLTAAAVVAGSAVILFDPIFQGLALSLMMGEVAATLLSRMTVPVLYYMLTRGRASGESETGRAA